MRRLLVVLPLLVALGACSGNGDQPRADASSSPSASSPSDSPSDGSSDGSDDGSDDGGVQDQPDASGTKVCAEVRAGVDDFNQGDLEGTVSHFKKALPLARARAADEDSQGAQSLLKAVQYYADLAPEDYPSAATSSPDFAKYKIITLGQCVVGSPQTATPTDPPGTSV